MRRIGLAGIVILIAGCSASSPYTSSVTPVSGSVLLPGGQPLRGNAEVTFVPKPAAGGIYGKEASGMVGPDGAFQLKTNDGEAGVPGGLYVVVVKPYGKNGERAAAARLIPKRYWSEDTSDLTIEIKGGEGPLTIELKK